MDKDGLPNDIETLQQMVLELSDTVQSQATKLEQREQKIKELLQALRGKQRERIDPDQLMLFDLGELETITEEEEEAEIEEKRRKKKKRRGRRLIPEHLPTEDVVYELPEDQRRCPHDGKPMPLIRYEISKQLEYEPAKMKVIVHKRAVYACPSKHDEAQLVIAPKPPQPIDKGLAGPGLLAQVVVSKFGDHLPGYRQEDIFSRHGVEIRRSTIYGWLSAVADLARPLYDEMKSRVLRSKVLHTDDTQVKLIDHTIGGTRLARFWAYLGDRGHPYTVYDFTETRKRSGPESFLKNFQGYLQADAYGGYDGIYLQSEGKIREVSCWAHCRRYWYKAREQDAARAHHVLGMIARLYRVEQSICDIADEDRLAARREQSKPILDQFATWLEGEEFLPKSLIGKAATYTRNQWSGLNRYIEDGQLTIDNNRAERAMKPVAIGRKNWLFVGSKLAGSRAAVLMTLVGSCKENQVEPWAYLRSLFKALPESPELEDYLPDRWLAANPKHRWTIDEVRREERKSKSN